MSQRLTQIEQTILKKKHPKEQNLFIFFHLIESCACELRQSKKQVWARFRRTFEFRVRQVEIGRKSCFEL